MNIVKYQDELHRQGTIALWQSVFDYSSSHNTQERSLDNKIAHNDGLFWIALDDDKQVCGSILGGYDGHRGWIYSLAVLPQYRHSGLGTKLLETAEDALSRLDCPKINLQIMPENRGVIEFYQKNGYQVEERISMGKKI